MKRRLRGMWGLLLVVILLLSCGSVNALAAIETIITERAIEEAGLGQHTFSVDLRSEADTALTRTTGNDVEFSLDDVTVRTGKKVSLNLSLTKNERAVSSATVRVYFRPDFLTFDSASVERDKDGYDTDWRVFQQAIESIKDVSATGYAAFDTESMDEQRAVDGWQSITFHYQINGHWGFSGLGLSECGTFGSLTFRVAEDAPAGMTIPVELEVVDATWSMLDRDDEPLTFSAIHGSIWIDDTSVVTPTPASIVGVYRITLGTMQKYSDKSGRMW